MRRTGHGTGHKHLHTNPTACCVVYPIRKTATSHITGGEAEEDMLMMNRMNRMDRLRILLATIDPYIRCYKNDCRN
jgi:hypothetical protein